MASGSSDNPLLCDGCENTVLSFTVLSEDQEKLTRFLYEHGVLQHTKVCPTCGGSMTLNEEKHAFNCWNRIESVNSSKKKVKIQCKKYVSQYKNTWFESHNLSQQTICRFVAIWMRTLKPAITERMAEKKLITLIRKKKIVGDFDAKLPVKKKRCSVNPKPVVTNRCIEKEHIIGDFFNCYQNGNISNSKLQKVAEEAVMKEIKSFKCCPLSCCTELSTDSRITALKWHPHNNNMFIFGSKHGSLFIGEVRNSVPKLLKFSRGSGVRNRIQTIIFDPISFEIVYTADDYGRIGIWNIMTDLLKPSFAFETHIASWNSYGSLDISADSKTLVAGDNKGQLLTMDLTSSKVEIVKVHKSKITHIEHCKRNPQLIVTSSLDKTVKLWDRRMLRKDKFLTNLEHSCAVNNAEFSLSDSNRLLTTDQMKQLRVYKAPNWTMETLIPHPHRMVQVVTQAKASWHPLADIIVIGRYPDASFIDPVCDEIRCIDFYSATSGKILYQMYEPIYKGITSLTRFNRSGNILLSAMGHHPMLWYTDAIKVTGGKLKKLKRNYFYDLE